ncbi:F-box protein At5g07610-like isoform X2 [Actinidia eriantha]|uniref:F-box protein At5g07610-like isoform X2 n=1 Tax=Actinidia eriantha TaxID=165200 RepID=UPI00258A859B|nr:F-box protein At5g07610-like isoform X2 [Actinidia eriantha]
MSEHSSSADQVAANDDLVTEILIRLPVKSLMQFKSVSKRWLSLITKPHFIRCRNPDPSYVSGLFFYSSMRRLNPELIFIPLQNDKNPTDNAYSTTFTTPPDALSIRILSSCYGLFCCSSYCHNTDRQFHIINPTTNQFASLPKLQDELQGLSLAFDPSRSPHYKVVCVWRTISVLSTKPYQSECHFQIEIYSSETGSWRASGDPFTADLNTQFLSGVYWNNAINWFNSSGESLYFNIEDERLGVMPMPPIPPGEWSGRQFRYYGESRGHLHLVEIYGPTTQFVVHEMERDYSGWFVKYHVDLHEVGLAFPDMLRRLSWDLTCCSFAILSLIRREEDVGSFLVLHVPGKILRYNLADKNFKELRDVGPEHCDSNGMIEDSIRLVESIFWNADEPVPALQPPCLKFYGQFSTIYH